MFKKYLVDLEDKFVYKYPNTIFKTIVINDLCIIRDVHNINSIFEDYRLPVLNNYEKTSVNHFGDFNNYIIIYFLDYNKYYTLESNITLHDKTSIKEYIRRERFTRSFKNKLME